MEEKKRSVEQTYYVSFDGKEFITESECTHYEAIKKGTRKSCIECEGAGVVVRDNDFGGDGCWGSPSGVQRRKETCGRCGGKGYLEIKEVWV